MVSLTIKFSVMVIMLVIASVGAVTSDNLNWIVGYITGSALMASLSWVYHDEKYRKMCGW